MGKIKQRQLVYSMFLVAILLFGCNYKSETEKSIRELLGSTILIPYNELYKVQNRGSINIAHKNCQKTLVIYKDSMSCAICDIKNLYKWDEYYNYLLSKNCIINIVIIFSPSMSVDIDNLTKNIQFSGTSMNIYIDEKGRFKSKNFNIPENRLFHSFVLDKEGKVILVGNPLENKRIEELLLKL